MALAEGSASDWLPLIVVDGFGLSESIDAIVYSGFGLFMAVGRLFGRRVIDRFGRAPSPRRQGSFASRWHQVCGWLQLASCPGA
ncbi:hypothetical protein [Sanguibacter antarcticus]|uniref:hypothetical protein n=1 Tax=Sanguibacter antarcticus TaxID=372484 RepID=UPI000BF546A2|nr:hypothetical protein [Sanguibacter antarcticus]